jgi:hypothetical protein
MLTYQQPLKERGPGHCQRAFLGSLTLGIDDGDLGVLGTHG